MQDDSKHADTLSGDKWMTVRGLVENETFEA